MRVQLLPFGVLKDVLRSAPIDLPDEATVADLLVILRSQLDPESNVAQLLPRIAVSVNAEYAQAGQILKEGDAVGLLPPVSGGSGQADTYAAPVVTYLTHTPIPADELTAAIKRGSDGAVVLFDGIVRDNTRGRRTLYLDYEAYEEMAAKQIAALADEAIERFGVRAITIVHRLGRLEVGESSVLILVASAHRAAAYEASRWLIDTLKKTVPIWKKETFADGAVWVDGEPFPAGLSVYSVTQPEEPEGEQGPCS